MPVRGPVSQGRSRAATLARRIVASCATLALSWIPSDAKADVDDVALRLCMSSKSVAACDRAIARYSQLAIKGLKGDEEICHNSVDLAMAYYVRGAVEDKIDDIRTSNKVFALVATKCPEPYRSKARTVKAIQDKDLRKTSK